MNSATALPQYSLRPRAPDRMGSGFALAIGVHLLLVVALGLGVSWRASEPAGVEAELWAAVPQVAAPKAVEPEPQPAKPVVEPPKPVVEPPKPVQREADLAVEKQRKERELKQREEEKEREQKAQKEQERKELEKKKADDARKKAEQEKAQQQRLEAERQKNLDRMMGQLGGTGAPNSTGTAAQSAGPSASYAGRIVARIKPNIVFTDSIVGDPITVVEVKVAPDGTIISQRIIKASTQPDWDNAVLRAVERTGQLPRDVDGRVPPTIEIRFRARDF